MRRELRRVSWIALGLLPALGLCGTVWGDTNCPKPTSASQSKTSAGADHKKDQVAAILALPKGTVLNAKQQKAYEKLKATNESPLRAAIRGTQSTNKDELAKSRKQVYELKTKIKAGIKEILAMPAVDAQKAAQQAAVKQYQTMAAERAARHGSGGGCPCGR